MELSRESTVRLTRAEQQERNRAALIRAARATIAARGPSAPLEAIAEAAGLTTGAVYSIFGSRRELVYATIEDQFSGHAEALAKLAATDLDLAGVLRACAVEGLSEKDIGDPDVVRTEFHEVLLILGDEELRGRVVELKKQVLARYTALLTGRVVPGTDPERRCTPEQATKIATVLRAVLSGYAMHAIVEGTHGIAGELGDACAALAALAR